MPYQFKVIFNAKCVWPNMTAETFYGKSCLTPSLGMKKKRIKNSHDVFYAQTKINLKNIPFFGVQCINSRNMYVALR